MKTSSKTIEEINEVLLLRLLELLPLAKDGYRYLESLEYYEEGLKEAKEKIGMAHRLIEYIGNHDNYIKSQAQELKEQNAELVEMLSLVCMDLEERGRAYGDVYTMSKELLTKHNHLKSNTNEN